MNNVKVKKEELLKVLKANKEVHDTEVAAAQLVFRKELEQELRSKLLKVEMGGKLPELYIQAHPPEEHTEDFENAIAMVEASVDDILELDFSQFKQWFQNKWGWAASYAAHTQSKLR